VKVLVDRHHADLFYGLQLLGDRLGWDLYTPVGHEWWDEGYWRFGEVYGDDRLARQYLSLEQGWQKVSGDVYWTQDRHHPERWIHGLPLEEARTQQWDLIIATVQENQSGFRRFADESGARYAVHVGNANQQVDMSLDPIVLEVAQEFDHLSTFRFRPPIRSDRVTSFINLLPLVPEALWAFDGLQQQLPDFEFRSFGHACPGGFLDPVTAVAAEMAEAGWAYHDKTTGDGFGHVIHNWAAVGRPLIGHSSYYAGQRAAAFWIDGETCIDLSVHSLAEAVEIIRATTPARHRAMCDAIRDVLDRVYDPARDAELVRELLMPVAA